jgi:hypothetical protein
VANTQESRIADVARDLFTVFMNIASPQAQFWVSVSVSAEAEFTLILLCFFRVYELCVI